MLFLFNTSCVKEAPLDSSSEANPYFDLKGLIDRQIYLLDSINPEVNMNAVISGEKESQTLRKDSADWAETLKLYAEADLNKPVLRGQYTVTDSSLQDSDLRLKIYQAKSGAEAEIPYMKVFYQDSLSEVRRVETYFLEENLLYSTQRNMSLEFDKKDGGVLLSAYSTTGKQKMIFRDSILYQNVASLQY